jgi:hypothetical protein
MTARIQTSEPAFRAPMSQWQRDRTGRVEPMAVLHVSSWEERAVYALAPLATIACVVAWCWS